MWGIMCEKADYVCFCGGAGKAGKAPRRDLARTTVPALSYLPESTRIYLDLRGSTWIWDMRSASCLRNCPATVPPDLAAVIGGRTVVEEEGGVGVSAPVVPPSLFDMKRLTPGTPAGGGVIISTLPL